MRAEKFVDVVEDAHRVRAQGHRGKRSLQHRGQQRRPQTFAADIGNQKRGALGSDGECIEVVTAHFMAGVVHSGDGQMRKIVQALRKQSLLNRAGDGEFLLQALPLALALHQPRIVQDAGGLHPQRIENLPVEIGKSRRPLGIKIQECPVAGPVSAQRTRSNWRGPWRTAEWR